MNALTLYTTSASDYRTYSCRYVIGAIIGGLAAAGISAATSIYNSSKQDKATKKANDYTKEQNALIMQREDNAVQRRLKDVKAAGFSPLVAANLGGAGAGSFTPLDTTTGQLDMSGASNAAASAGQAVDSYRLAKAQQNFAERQYNEAAGDRANQSTITASNAAKAVIDAQKYGEEKNVAMDTAKLAYETAKVQASDAHQAALDSHAESVLRRSGLSTENAQKALELKIGNATMADKIRQIQNEASASGQVKVLNDTMIKLKDEEVKTAKQRNEVQRALKQWAHDNGYATYEQYLQDYQQSRDRKKDLNDGADKLISLLGTVMSAIQ